MSVLSQYFTARLNGQDVLGTFNRDLVLPHTDAADITLKPGETTTLDLTRFGLTKFSLQILSQYTQLSPYIPAPYTVKIDNGATMQFDDLCVMNLSARPNQIVLGLPAGATAPVKVRIAMAGT